MTMAYIDQNDENADINADDNIHVNNDADSIVNDDGLYIDHNGDCKTLSS